MKIKLGLAVGLLFTMVGCSKDYDIVTSHGFKVINDGNNKDSQTKIVAQITGNPDKDGYIIATNLYDKKDTVAIDKGHFKKGDKVIIQFDNDTVVKVKKL